MKLKEQKEISKNKQKKFKYLSNAERSEIEILRNRRYSTRKIGKVLHRSHNTVAYELRRCTKGNYRVLLAKQYSRTKLKNRKFQFRKMNQNKELREYIVQGLKKSWNPHEISGRLRLEKSNMNISTVSIYNWILNDVRENKYTKSLYMFRKKRRSHRKRGLHGRIQYMVSIHDRPGIENKAQHWETDLVVSSRKGIGALSTV